VSPRNCDQGALNGDLKGKSRHRPPLVKEAMKGRKKKSGVLKYSRAGEGKKDIHNLSWSPKGSVAIVPVDLLGGESGTTNEDKKREVTCFRLTRKRGEGSFG